MHGRLDELYFYDRALSPDEVKRLYLASSEPVARLELLASSPAPASSDVALLSDLRLSFSRPIDPASLSGSVTLRRAGVTVPVRLVLDRE